MFAFEFLSTKPYENHDYSITLLPASGSFPQEGNKNILYHEKKNLNIQKHTNFPAAI